MSEEQEQTHADRFIKLYAQPRSSSGIVRIDRWIHVDSIDEICDGEPRRKNAGDDKSEIISPTVNIRMHGGLRDGHAYWLIADGTAADVVQEIEAMRAAGAATDAAALAAALKPLLVAPEPRHALNERGVWTAGESYVPLDHVTHPDTAAGHLCMANNKSSSAGVLANTKFWCRLDLPEAS